MIGLIREEEAGRTGERGTYWLQSDRSTAFNRRRVAGLALTGKASDAMKSTGLNNAKEHDFSLSHNTIAQQR